MKHLFLFWIIAILLSCNSSTETTPTSDVTTKGETLFTINCSNCHKPDEDFVGPALKGAASRWENKALLYEFVKNPTAVIQKDAYAAGLQQKYSSTMTSFPDLNKDEIDAILAYCNQ
ncbi:MAG TPA: cytochrome c [Ferruginibacter sp.]|jgi:cytochrome c|nr:cytochrome c [Ferruginibacter sp.]